VGCNEFDFWRQKISNKRNKNWRQNEEQTLQKLGPNTARPTKIGSKLNINWRKNSWRILEFLKWRIEKMHLSGKINFYKSTSQNSLSIDLFKKL
jgi:hypothetical protein